MTANKLEGKARELLAECLEELNATSHGPVLEGSLRDRIIRALDTARQSEGMVLEGFYVASFKRSGSNWPGVLWWMPNNAGYSTDLEQAGIYTEIVPGYHDNEDTVPVPVSFINGLRVRRTVDPGDSLNQAFHSAKSLRAILAAAPADAGEVDRGL